MIDAVAAASRSAAPDGIRVQRHSRTVRITHWLTVICCLALLISGSGIVISHPRFYWGDTGHVLTPSLFEIPIPSSRPYVKTGYDFVLPDYNGWSRSLHFQAAWVLLLAGVVYAAHALFTRHLRDNLLPARSGLTAGRLLGVLRDEFRLKGLVSVEEAGHKQGSYNIVQRLTYLAVVFVLFPLIIWTGLAMSPAVVSVSPALVTVLGGHQSARTLHFFLTVMLILFVLVHVLMVYRAGFLKRTRAMMTGSPADTRPRG